MQQGDPAGRIGAATGLGRCAFVLVERHLDPARLQQDEGEQAVAGHVVGVEAEGLLNERQGGQHLAEAQMAPGRGAQRAGVAQVAQGEALHPGPVGGRTRRRIASLHQRIAQLGAGPQRVGVQRHGPLVVLARGHCIPDAAAAEPGDRPGVGVVRRAVEDGTNQRQGLVETAQVSQEACLRGDRPRIGGDELEQPLDDRQGLRVPVQLGESPYPHGQRERGSGIADQQQFGLFERLLALTLVGQDRRARAQGTQVVGVVEQVSLDHGQRVRRAAEQAQQLGPGRGQHVVRVLGREAASTRR